MIRGLNNTEEDITVLGKKNSPTCQPGSIMELS